MNNRMLSVVVTVYNEEKYIRECLNSVINQTYKALDIIVVDDGSSDRSLEICKEIEKIDDRISIIAKKNGGSVSARKAGIRQAKGDYITYIDGDDWLELDHYEKIMNEIGNADIYAFSLTCIYDNNEKEVISNECGSGVYENHELMELKNKSLYSGEFGKFGLFPSMCAKVFRRSLIEDNLYQVSDDIRMGDDGACTFPSICDAKKIIINNNVAGYLYRKTVTNSITSGYSFTEFDRIESLYKVLEKEFVKRNADYMMKQMPEYFAFLYRTEMVKELANPKPSNILKKYKNLKYASKLKWIKCVEKSEAYTSGINELKYLKPADKPFFLLYDWYFKRHFK